MSLSKNKPGWDYPKLIINVALTGMVPDKNMNEFIPITADEIALDAERCFQSGARIAHVHAREENGKPAWQPEIYAEIITKIRERCPDMLICASTSGRQFQEIEKRSAVLLLEDDLKPDLATLTVGSLNFIRQASINSPQIIRELATIMSDRGIKPEIEVFDLGMLDFTRYLLDKGLLDSPIYTNIFLGSLGTLAATPANFATMLSSLPDNAAWGATGIGRFQHLVNCQAIALQGHVRVGLEDNIWMDYEQKIPATNPMLVQRLVQIAESMGREIASPQQTREMLSL